MFEESASPNPSSSSSILASMNSWFTPTVLFVLLNLMIATILFSSTISNQNHQKQEQQKQQEEGDDSHQNEQHQQSKLAKSPSVLQRLKSMNIYNFRSQELLKQTLDSHSNSHVQETIESHTQYIFEQPHQNQPILTYTHFDFPQTHQENVPNLLPHLDLQQAHQQNVPVSQTHFDFQLAYQENVPISQTHFSFQQAHQENVPRSMTHFDFQQPHEEHVPKSHTLFSFKQPHEEFVPKSQTLFDFQQPHQEFVPKSQTHEANFPKSQTHFEETEEDEKFQSLDEFYSQLAHASRTNSDTKPSSGEIPAKSPEKMKKSASMKSAFNHFEEADIVESKRPATVRERRVKVTDDDDQVDAKADDFINKFKQQLKLQRLDSISGTRMW